MNLYIMRSFFIFVVIVTISFMAFGCKNKESYTVMADEEAVITQDGKIVGQVKGPGVHYINPSLQKAHIIKKHLIRKLEFSCQPKNNFEIILFWNVSDSKKYFLFSRSKSVEDINEEIKVKVSGVVGGIGLEYAIEIAANQKENPQYIDKEFNKILIEMKKVFEPLGINIDLLNIVMDSGA